MKPKKSIEMISLILIIFLLQGTIALAYNPFIPDYDLEGFPGSEPRGHLSTDNADFVLRGKKTGTELRGNIDFIDTKNHWAQESIFKMAAQSVLRGYGLMRFSPESSITRQEALAMLVRIMGREDEVQRRTAFRGIPPEGGSVTGLWAQEYITLAQDMGILDIGEGGDWQGNATRQEVAVWLARALRLQPIYGSEQQYLYNLRDWERISLTNQPLVEAILHEDIMKGDDRGFFNPGSGLKRSEIAVMLDRAADRFYSLRGLEAHSVEIIQRGTLDGAPAFSVQKTDGGRGIITLSGGGEFPVLRKGVIGLSGSLQPGDEIDIITDNEGVLYALVSQGGTAETLPRGVTEGYVRAVDAANSRLSITDYDGNVHTYRYGDDLGITINDRPAGIMDLKFGLEVAFELRGNTVTGIRSSYALEQPGYIPPDGRVRTGRVTMLDKDSLTLGLDSGEEESYSIINSTVITKEGTAIPAGSIMIGDRAWVYTSAVSSNAASRINIEGKQQLIQDVYRGVLEAVHPSGGTLVLREAAVFVNGDWEERERRVTLELSPGTQIYYGDRAITPRDMQSGYLNAVAYVAVNNNFGNRQAVTVALKRGSEQLYGGRIRDISWGTGEIELRDRNNIMIRNSSIILSAGRRVDISALDEECTVTVVADRYGGLNNAAVVMLEDIKPTGDEIFVGRLDEIRTREFDMNYYSQFEENEWERLSSRSRFLTFEYDRDTYIMEVDGNRIKTVNAGDFFQGDYAEDRYARSRRDYYAFVIADGNRARAIRIMRGSITRDGSTIDNVDLEKLRATTGEIRSIDIVMDILTISKATNWSNFYGQWERADADNYVNYAAALIIKDGRIIDAKDLKPGESVYIIRDDNRGIIIMAL